LARTVQQDPTMDREAVPRPYPFTVLRRRGSGFGGFVTRFKQAFTIDLVEARVTCHAQQIVAIPPGATTVYFAATTFRPCALRPACTTATRAGRSLAPHPQEAFLQGLRATQHQPAGRAALRERTTVEHSLARIDQIQGATARYKGTRKNTLDLRRTAVVANLQRLARLPKAARFTCSALVSARVPTGSDLTGATAHDGRASRWGWRVNACRITR
jgi:hypothetical protein